MSRRLAAGALVLASFGWVSVADGKKPDRVPEPAGAQHGNGHGNGHGPTHGVVPAPPPPPPAPAVAPPAPAPQPATRHGNGNGNGHGNGHGHRSATPPATPPPAPPPQQQPAKQPVTASPTPTPSSAPPQAPTPVATPQPVAQTPTGSQPSTAASRNTILRGGDDRRSRASDRAGRRIRAGQAGPHGAPNGRVFATPSYADPASTLATAPANVAKRNGARTSDSAEPPRKPGERSPIVRTLERIVEVIPLAVKAIILVLGLLLVCAAAAWFLLARTTRYLRRHRETLLEEVGVLQGALLPAVPAELSRLQASVAYKPAGGLAAGGDFYDAFALDDGRVGIVVGDVAGHGRDALMHTALLRYTLRAYLEADLEPRAALQVAGRALDRGFDTLATVVLAVYDPNARVLRYASAGHPPPVFLGDADHVPVTVSSSPPIGAGLPTGVRQTTVSLPAESAVCFFTDGLIEARRGEQLIGRLGLVDIIRALGPTATAAEVLESVAAEADRVDDDMAACMFRVSDGATEAGSSRIEEIEVRRGEPLEVTLRRFLVACRVDARAISNTIVRADQTMRRHAGAVVQVSIDGSATSVAVRPANVESFAAAEARRDATAFAVGSR